MPPRVVDDTAAFNEHSEKLFFYLEIIHNNQPFVVGNIARAHEIHDEVSNHPQPHTKEEYTENLKKIEAFCHKEPNGLDDHIRLYFAGMGAMALLPREDSGLSLVRQCQAAKIANDCFNAKYFGPEIMQHMQDAQFLFPPPFNRIKKVSKDAEMFLFEPQEAVNFVRQDPFYALERLHGVGLEEDLDLKWQLMGVSVGRGQIIYDLEYGTDSHFNVDEDALTGLIMKTKEIYMLLD